MQARPQKKRDIFLKSRGFYGGTAFVFFRRGYIFLLLKAAQVPSLQRKYTTYKAD